MDNTESILFSIKKLLGIDTNYTHFDSDLIIHINSVFSQLTQMGIGPTNGYSIDDEHSYWYEFNEKTDVLALVKSYIYLKVKILFDPPLSSTAVESINRQISEFEWRLFVAADSISEEGKIQK